MLIEHVKPDCTCSGAKCKQCQTVLCRGKFSKNNKAANKLQSSCKDCQKAYLEVWRPQNVEHLSEYDKNCYHTHKDEKQAYHRAYCQTFVYKQGAKKQNDKTYRTKHAKRLKVLKRNQYVAHLVARRAHSREYAKNHRMEARERLTHWRAANPEHRKATAIIHEHTRKARKLNVGGSYTVAQWKALKSQYNYACLCCKRREPDIKLTADHIVPIVKGGSNDIENIQPLCGDCNCHKFTKVIDYRSTFNQPTAM